MKTLALALLLVLVTGGCRDPFVSAPSPVIADPPAPLPSGSWRIPPSPVPPIWRDPPAAP